MIIENQKTILKRNFRWLSSQNQYPASQNQYPASQNQAPEKKNEDTKKPILLLLHGFPDSAFIWSDWFSYFSGDFEVIAPFLPLAGEVSDHRFQLDALALDYMTFLSEEKFKNRPIHIVAHDVGVVLGFPLAQMMGATVLTKTSRAINSLTAINGLSLEQFKKRLTQPTQLAKSWYMGLMQVPGLASRIFHKHPKLFQKILKKFVSTNQNIGAEGRSYPLYRAWIKEALSDKNIRQQKLHIPLLVLWTTQDPFLNAPTWSEFATVASNITIRMMEGSHWAHLENPADITKQVKGFIQL